MKKSVCVTASRDGVGTSSWGGGEALTKMQRSRKAASASVADRWSLVIVQVGPVRTCEWVALNVACEQDTELEGAASCDSRVEADICTGDGEVAPACNC